MVFYRGNSRYPVQSFFCDNRHNSNGENNEMRLNEFLFCNNEYNNVDLEKLENKIKLEFVRKFA